MSSELSFIVCVCVCSVVNVSVDYSTLQSIVVLCTQINRRKKQVEWRYIDLRWLLYVEFDRLTLTANAQL